MVTHTVHTVGVGSLAKILGVMGLLWGLAVALAWFGAGLLGADLPGLPELALTVVGGVVYGVVVGAVTAILYNAAASVIDGVELDLSVDPVAGRP